MRQVTLFEQKWDGELYLEWKRLSRGYCWIAFNVRGLSRSQFKRVIRLILNSGTWYQDASQDGYGEWNDFGTLTPGSDTRELTATSVVRWLWSIRH